MATPVRRPERRNRKIGTAAAGHGQNNKMAIPNSRMDRFGNATEFYERMQFDCVIERIVHDTQITVLYENPREGYNYGCTPEDVLHLLSMIPEDHHYLLEFIIFRQPTNKQSQQSPVWGRLIYCAEVGNGLGPAIIIEAQKDNSELFWPRKISLEGQDEINRLKADGHKFERTKRAFVSKLCPMAHRNTVLYRTLLHEFGHLKQYVVEVLDEDTALSDDYNIAGDLYDAKPSSEREQYANRYADELSEKLRLEGHIPFDPIDIEISTKT
ncbi:MAG: hypothetical protein V7776_12900 [Halopseudomonas aestusnigri]